MIVWLVSFVIILFENRECEQAAISPAWMATRYTYAYKLVR